MNEGLTFLRLLFPTTVMNATFSLGGIIGPSVVGALRKSSGGSTAPLIASTFFALCSFLLFNLLHAPAILARIRGRRLKRKGSDFIDVAAPGPAQ